MIWALFIAGAYLLGSISWSVLVVRRLQGRDIRSVGSGNAGATNVLRFAGRGPAALVLLLDVLKGALPVQAARALDAPGPVLGAVATAAVVGHAWPIFHGFRGGKGVATVTGALGFLAPLAAALAVGVFVATLFLTRYVAVASMVAVSSFPLSLQLLGLAGWRPPPPGWLLLTAALLAALVIFLHRDNLRRILAGSEHRVGRTRRRET